MILAKEQISNCFNRTKEKLHRCFTGKNGHCSTITSATQNTDGLLLPLEGFKCPSCGHELKTGMNCRECGQAIRWNIGSEKPEHI